MSLQGIRRLFLYLVFGGLLGVPLIGCSEKPKEENTKKQSDKDKKDC